MDTGTATYEADVIVLGLGVCPNTDVARSAGLPLGSFGGIRVDLRMAVPGHDGVWAAGDCVESFDRVSQTWAHTPLGTHANKQGRVLVDGIDVRDWSMAALRSQISTIEQDIFLFSRTVAENIAFGRPDATDLRLCPREGRNVGPVLRQVGGAADDLVEAELLLPAGLLMPPGLGDTALLEVFTRDHGHGFQVDRLGFVLW